MTTRRGFLQGAAAAAFASGLMRRALAIAPAGRTGTLADVEHIVVFMQENRAFDHYFGMLSGVRGFGDPRPLALPAGRSVWQQSSAEHPDGYVMPFHGDSTVARAFTVHGSGQSHQDNIGILNRGRWSGWGETGELHKRMLHYGPGDLPFYYALADAFTICDAYHCSTLTQTYPNRLHLFTGCNGGGGVGGDPEMENYGEDETPSADMATDKPLEPGRYAWTTYAERLQAAGISWKVYQEYDNFGDNILSVFPAFRPCHPSSDLYRRGRAWVSEHKPTPDRTRSDGEQLVAAFRADLAAGTLPQVSWIVTADALSEHPDAEPARGEHVCAKLIEALVDHPEMFARTAFIINYDEPGGFFDHLPPPVPPVGDYRGHSTVSVEGEAKQWHAGTEIRHTGAHPLGLGARVPAIVVSPWTRGGWVCSETFDHTSVIRLIERRFGVAEPNISPWRRAVCGDLTSAFDFSGRSTTVPGLPATDDFAERIARSAAGTALSIPAVQAVPRQMAGRRRLRPAGYRLLVEADRAPNMLLLSLANPGTLGASFTLRDVAHDEEPWHFTLGSGHSHRERIATNLSRYHYVLSGPAGAQWTFAGDADDAGLSASLMPGSRRDTIMLRLTNNGPSMVQLRASMLPPYAEGGMGDQTTRLMAGATETLAWSVSASDGWFDLTVEADRHMWQRGFAGRFDTGLPARTDPAIGRRLALSA